MKTIRRTLAVLVLSAITVMGTPAPSFAHDAPDQGQAAWLMADWMLLSFLVFFGVALLAFIVVVKRGYLRNLEQAKYHILTIDEQDYYTPDWAREEVTDDERS